MKSFGSFSADNPEFYKPLFENPPAVDYGYQGKRYFNVLNVQYQADQYRRRLTRYLGNEPFEKKKAGKMFWLSKLPMTYFQKYGHWGDSLFTLKYQGKDAYSIKPDWAE